MKIQRASFCNMRLFKTLDEANQFLENLPITSTIISINEYRDADEIVITIWYKE